MGSGLSRFFSCRGCRSYLENFLNFLLCFLFHSVFLDGQTRAIHFGNHFLNETEWVTIDAHILSMVTERAAHVLKIWKTESTYFLEKFISNHVRQKFQNDNPFKGVLIPI